MLRTVATRIARRAAASASSSSPRCFAAAAQGKGDLVKDFFADSQRKFRAYAEKSKTNPLPLDGDEAKLKAYVEKNKQIMAEIGIPSVTERIDDAIDGAFEEATSVRQYLEYTNQVRQAMGLDDPTGVYKTLFQTLDDVEKKIDKALTPSDPQFAQFQDAIEKGMGELLGKSLDELADAADMADAKEEASRLKADMEATKARAG